MKVYSTKLYEKWIERLKDNKAKAIIRVRIRKIELYGHFGDCETISKNVSELRIDYGPGYRIYMTLKGPVMVILLLGEDKSTQAKDIKKAEKMAADVIVEEFV